MVQLFSDYHTHPQGHRVQRYTQALLQPWPDSARKIALSDIAFTDHDRYHAGIDFDEIDRLREKNADLKIRAGIELDNDPVHSAPGRKWIEKYWDKLDFVLGSVHFLDRDDQMFDSVPAGAQQFYGRDIDAIYADYFRRVFRALTVQLHLNFCRLVHHVVVGQNESALIDDHAGAEAAFRGRRRIAATVKEPVEEILHRVVLLLIVLLWHAAFFRGRLFLHHLCGGNIHNRV